MKKDITTYTEGEAITVPLGNIRILPGVNMREVDPVIVAEYVVAMNGYGPLHVNDRWGQPLSITTCGILVNGGHTHAAAVEAFGQGFEFNCIVNGTGEAEAYLLAATHNGKHGVRFSNAEKREAVTRWLTKHPEFTDGYIAKQTNVSRQLVQKVAAELATTASLDRPDKRCFLDSDGQKHWIETDKIGETQAELLEQTPSKTEQITAQREFRESQETTLDRQLRKLQSEIKRTINKNKKIRPLYKGNLWFDDFCIAYRSLARQNDDCLPFPAPWTANNIERKTEAVEAYKKFLESLHQSPIPWVKFFLADGVERQENSDAEEWVKTEGERIFMDEKLCEEWIGAWDDRHEAMDDWKLHDVWSLFEKARETSGVKGNDHLAIKAAIENRDDWFVAFLSENRQRRVAHRLKRAIETLDELRDYLPPMLGLWADAFLGWQTGDEFKRDITIAESDKKC